APHPFDLARKAAQAPTSAFRAVRSGVSALHPPRPDDDPDKAAIRADLAELEDLMLSFERLHASNIAAVHPDHQPDAANLVHYLALRHGDVRLLQRRLGERGLSSLGRCEPHVLATVESARAALDGGTALVVPEALRFEEGRAALDRNTDALFGPRPPGRVPRVMVTLPSEAADDYHLVRRLVASGMDVARINGAHDHPVAWESMARNVRKASSEVDRPCRVSMDLAGPKVRTGPFVEGPRVVRLRPERDLRGVAITPVLVELVDPEAPEEADPGRPVLPVDGSWIGRRRLGDVVGLVDTRGSPRQLRVVSVAPEPLVVEAWDTTYVETGTTLSCDGDTADVGTLAPVAQFHVLHVGDLLRLTGDPEPAVPWRHGQAATARIGCTLPAALKAAKPGQRVILDDGKMTGVVERVTVGEVEVRILTAAPRGTRLRAEKGINFPETELPVRAVTDDDLPLLEVAAAHADMVAVSFLRHECDVDEVHDYLRRVGAQDLGLILKIETTAAFNRLPEILLHAMRSPLVGVMIARGDLAVEVGYERLAEVQEEIMWLCEAAHLPAIWATEVLDRMARTGLPSRAEVTDAAMAQRAECVMLNKGPHVDEAIVVLDDILRRMSGHQRKKTALLRPLRSWADGF
ncbi:MAG TPA: pyruvate kinase, partial [Acidimicrobiales bacterium]|nr:pyruvate kinase [Acidimicrobiales bacterium]